ncbi:bromodomain-containing protein 8-like [Tachyglossus aculeatus]|uniref:bromodomain-containing protein 8-like n=1 Tax=Tachyglossus aculeatus TaxID=9261 RepID=UPI0018F4305D|nr:bromodomain-containing protein 8-like [Tachyglossus aculeatus]
MVPWFEDRTTRFVKKTEQLLADVGSDLGSLSLMPVRRRVKDAFSVVVATVSVSPLTDCSIARLPDLPPKTPKTFKSRECSRDASWRVDVEPNPGGDDRHRSEPPPGSRDPRPHRDLGSWREMEEPGGEDHERSSPERGGSPPGLSDPEPDGGSGKEFREEGRRCHQNVLQFLSEVAYLMEPLSISSKGATDGGRAQPSCSPPEGSDARAAGGEAEEPAPEPPSPGAPRESGGGAGLQLPQDTARQEHGEPDVGEGSAGLPARGPGDDDKSRVAAASLVRAPLDFFFGSGPAISQRTDRSRSDSNPDHLLLKKTLLPLWKMIASHRFSSPFLKPVSDRQAPGYKDVVKRPMDLTSLKRNLSKGRIGSTAQFQRDLMLMFLNAVMYNAANHHVYHMAVDMQREVLEQIQVLSIWLDRRREMSGLD